MDEQPTCSRCGSAKAIEVHNTSYKPPTTIFLCRKCHQETHKTAPIEGRLTEVMRQYHLYTKLGTQLKNWSKAWDNQFENLNDPQLEAFLKEIKTKQKELLKEAEYELRDKVKLCEKWKGVGIRNLAYMFAFAHPQRFSSLRKFLYYCGRKEEARKNKNFSRIASTMAYQIAISLVRAKDEKYYPLYLKIKSEFKKDRLIIIHRKTLNRISTLWLKDFYTQTLNTR